MLDKEIADMLDTNTNVTEKDWTMSIQEDPSRIKNEKDYFLDDLYGESKLDTIINIGAERTYKRNYDLQVAVTGEEGSGKSLASIFLGLKHTKRINYLSKMNDKPLNLQYTPRHNVIYGDATYDQIGKFVTTIPQYSAFSLDEAIDTMYSRNFNKKGQIKQNALWTKIRKRNLAGYLNIPKFTELDSKFKFGRIFWWIHIFKRGKAGLFVKDPNPLNEDPFNTKRAKQVIDKYTKDKYDVDEMIKALHKNVKNFVIWFKIPELESDIVDEYNSLADLNSPDAIAAMQESIGEKYENVLTQSILSLFELGQKPKVLALKYGLTEAKVRKIIKEAREKTNPNITNIEANIDDINESEEVK